MADDKVDDDTEQGEETIVDSPLPTGPAVSIPLPIADTAGAITEDVEESKCEDGETGVCKSGEGVIFVRTVAGGCPIGVIDRPDPAPTGAIGA